MVDTRVDTRIDTRINMERITNIIGVTDFIPNDEQEKCMSQVKQFILNNKPFSRMLINGSAGTGKTTIIISSIVTTLLEFIAGDIEKITIMINAKKFDYLDKFPDFIIAAPTNKAKDVLISKYDILLANIFSQNETNNTHTPETQNIFKNVLKRKIVFLTVSQILCISRIINELGEEEFSKGNENKITKKYSHKSYYQTRIIIDECSMIDVNTFKLLTGVRCPIVYIGDYCQLPPVNEILSPTFNLDQDISSIVIKLMKVERCKNQITNIANQLRDKIYHIITDFNILKYDPIPELKIYNKQFSKWIDMYVSSIKNKQREITDLKENDVTKLANAAGSQQYDTMALGWTNKCCSFINKKIRELLFIDIEDIDEHFIILGDKLFVKNNYMKYTTKINPSTIVYVSKLDTVKYKPLTFSEWCNVISKIEEKAKSLLNNVQPSHEIDINAIFDVADSYTDIPIAIVTNQPEQKKKTSITDYFNIVMNNDLDNEQTSDQTQGNAQEERTNLERKRLEKEKNDAIKKQREYNELRKEFYIHHNLAAVILEGLYEFSDIVSMKYNDILQSCMLSNIKNLPRASKPVIYMEWHKKVSTQLFGLPNDRIHCKKCAFFAKKFTEGQYRDSCYMKDMIIATENLQLNIYLCNLVVFSINGKTHYTKVPIINSIDRSNIETLDAIKNIIKNSFEMKILLTKQEERELNSINQEMGEEEFSTDSVNTNTPVKTEDTQSSKQQAYITMSQMLGHYFSHIFSSVYLEVDYGYALTVHKSQGSTYWDVYMEYSNIATNRKDTEKYKLLYTALTRCANNLHVYY